MLRRWNKAPEELPWRAVRGCHALSAHMRASARSGCAKSGPAQRPAEEKISNWPIVRTCLRSEGLSGGGWSRERRCCKTIPLRRSFFLKWGTVADSPAPQLGCRDDELPVGSVLPRRCGAACSSAGGVHQYPTQRGKTRIANDDNIDLTARRLHANQHASMSPDRQREHGSLASAILIEGGHALSA